MSRSAVIALAAVVIVGLGALWYFAVRDDSNAAPAEPPATAASTPTDRPVGVGPALTPEATGPVLTSAGKPRQPLDTSNMETRDHRTGTTAAGSTDDIVDKPAPPPGPAVPRDSARALYQRAGEHVLACGRQIAAADRGSRPRIGVMMKLAIVNGSVKVVDATPEADDVIGPDVERVKQCVHDAVLGMEVPATGAEDAADLPLNLSFVLR